MYREIELLEMLKSNLKKYYIRQDNTYSRLSPYLLGETVCSYFFINLPFFR